MGALISFLGGAGFRLVWGSITDWFNKKQEHKQELDSLKLQGELDSSKHTRDLEKMRLVTELGIKEILVKSEASLEEIDAKSFGEAAAVAIKPIGIRLVDAWNGCIRPAAATIALILWTNALYIQDFHLTSWDMELIGAILGFYFAARTFAKGH